MTKNVDLYEQHYWFLWTNVDLSNLNYNVNLAFTKIFIYVKSPLHRIWYVLHKTCVFRLVADTPFVNSANFHWPYFLTNHELFKRYFVWCNFWLHQVCNKKRVNLQYIFSKWLEQFCATASFWNCSRSGLTLFLHFRNVSPSVAI